MVSEIVRSESLIGKVIGLHIPSVRHVHYSFDILLFSAAVKEVLASSSAQLRHFPLNPGSFCSSF